MIYPPWLQEAMDREQEPDWKKAINFFVNFDCNNCGLPLSEHMARIEKDHQGREVRLSAMCEEFGESQFEFLPGEVAFESSADLWE